MGKEAMKNSSSILWILNIQITALAFAQAPIEIYAVHLGKARLYPVVSSTSVILEYPIPGPQKMSESIQNYSALYRPGHLPLELWCQNLRT